MHSCCLGSLLGVVTSTDVKCGRICENSVYIDLFVSQNLNRNIVKVFISILVETFPEIKIDTYLCDLEDGNCLPKRWINFDAARSRKRKSHIEFQPRKPKDSNDIFFAIS